MLMFAEDKFIVSAGLGSLSLACTHKYVIHWTSFDDALVLDIRP